MGLPMKNSVRYELKKLINPILRLKMLKCKYKNKYFDYEKKATLEYTCNEEALSSGFCMYHDETFEKPEEKIKGIEVLIKKALSKKKPLFCIGYYIPNIKIKKTFSESVYFTKAKFQNCNFSGSKFNKVDFSGAKFQNIDFSESEFSEADFFGVVLNPNNDQQNDTEFFVFASGTQADAIATPTSGEDFGWNAVWDSAVSIVDDGWIIEMKIPYATLRFSNKAKRIPDIQRQTSCNSCRDY